MCLGIQLTEGGQKKIINQAKKKGYIRVWKCVRLRPTYFGYWLASGRYYKKGIHRTIQRCMESGWHAFRDKKSARQWCIRDSDDIVIECLALPEWVKNIGNSNGLQTILFTKLFFPEYPNRKAKVKDFRAAVKKEK